MINRLSNMMFGVVLVLFFAVVGCGGKKDPLATGPQAETIALTTDYVFEAIEAAGGYRAWRNAKKLQLNGVVTFYNPDGSYYLT